MNEKYQTNGPLLVGPVVRPTTIETGQTLGVLPENRDLFLSLSRRYRVRRHEDGWFVDGRAHRTQIWEFGIGRLGLTVTGPKWVARCLRLEWLKKGGVGDKEANFNCPWDSEHLERLESLLKLQRRQQRRSTVG